MMHLNNEGTYLEDMQSLATQYFKRELVTIPVEAKEKATFINGWDHRTLDDFNMEEFNNNKNIGVCLGKQSSNWVDIDLDCAEAIRIADRFLPETGVTFGRASNLSHWIYKVEDCGNTKRWQCNNGVILEARANGAYTVFPPSIHPTGEHIIFNKFEEPAEINWDKLLYITNHLAAASLIAQNWKKDNHNRHDLALSLSGALLNNGWQFHKVEHFIESICLAADDEEIRDRITAIKTTVSKMDKSENVTGLPTFINLISKPVADKVIQWLGLDSTLPNQEQDQITVKEHKKSILLTDAGNAMRFIKQHKGHVRYVSDMGVWLFHKGNSWVSDNNAGIVHKLAQQTANSIYDEILKSPDSKEKDDLGKWAKASNNHKRIKDMIAEARPHLIIPSSDLDKDPYLLNCANGTLNLKNGNLQKHNASDYITKITVCNYNKDADCPIFKEFLNKIMDGNQELIDFIQRALGYSLTGLTTEHAIFINHGTGANGKTTLQSIISRILNDYGLQTPVETLMQKKSGGINNDIARLKGARFVTASEGEANQKLAESTVKQLTGGDKMAARFLYKELFEFTPECKIWMATNHKPQISGSDPAIWRRVHLIPFSVTIPAEQRDPELLSKLFSEAEGILAWMVEGCLSWQNDGLNPPEIVRVATDSYRIDSDDVYRFISECVTTDNSATTTKDDLYKVYECWRIGNDAEMLSKRTLGGRLKTLGHKDKKISAGWIWRNIKIKNECLGWIRSSLL